MKRLLFALLLALSGFAFIAGPSLRTAYATIIGSRVEVTLPPGDLHPAVQALNFLLKPPETEDLGKGMKLWATYYHMPTVRPAKSAVTARPLLGRNGKAISPPLTVQDWCDAAMQGSIWVDDGSDEPTAYMFVDSRGPEQFNCDRYFGELSATIKSATMRARFVAFHHPHACDVRPIPLMAFRTIAVDPSKIKFGTVLYVPKLRGQGFWKDGELFAHDGYVVASDRGGAIEGNHIDMFVDNAAGKPFPDIVRSNPRHTFDAFIVPKDDPAAIALSAAHTEVCRDSDGPGRKRQKPQPKAAGSNSI